MEITQETSSAAKEGRHGCISVGTTPTRVWHSAKLCRGSIVVAAKTNTAPIAFGVNSGVTCDTQVTGGIPLDAGGHLVVPFDNLADLWAVSTAEGQKLFFLGV